MRKNPYGKILKREPKEQRINTVPKFCSKIIEYSRNTINAYSPPPLRRPLTWIVGSTINLISGTHNYVKERSMHLWYSRSIQ